MNHLGPISNVACRLQALVSPPSTLTRFTSLYHQKTFILRLRKSYTSLFFLDYPKIWQVETISSHKKLHLYTIRYKKNCMPSPIQKCDIWNTQKYDNLKITGSFILPYLLLASPGGFELCWNDNRPKKCNRVPCVSDIIHVYCAQEKREYFSKGALENNIWPFNKKSYNYKQWWGSWKWPSVGTLGKLIFISRKACVCHALAQFQGDPSLKCYK